MSVPLAHQLAAAVAQAAEGTPYAVTPTEDGFDVGLNVVDATWYGVLNKAGLRRTVVHHVAVRESDRSYTVTDESRTVSWVAGVPRLGGSGAVAKGRIIELGVKQVWALDEHGRFGVQAEYRFTSQEGRALVDAVAGRMGLRSRRGAAELAGLVMALVALGGLAIGAVVTVVLLLLGVR